MTVNTARISREDLLSRLQATGVRAERGRYATRTVRVLDPISPERLPGFAEGLFFVQDEASALAGEALGATAGERVLDVCAAPGGKTLGAAVSMSGVGELFAYDLHESKLSLIGENAARLGFSVKTGSHDATVYDREKERAFDRVICDVPCSGLGVLGKKPDLRYRERNESLSALGYRILETSARYVKEGGVLLYSTCTLVPDENEENVRRFLDAHPEYRATPFVLGGGALRAEEGMLTLWPHRHGTDGFFIAKLTRG